MCFIELVDYNENMMKVEKKAPKTRRSRRKSAAAQTTGDQATETASTVSAEAPVEETVEKSAE